MYGLECEKCGKAILYGISTRLVGGVHTVLCPLCQTEWDGYVSSLDLYTELLRLDAVRASMVFARELSADNTDPVLLQVHGEILACKRMLRQVGLGWLGRNGS